MPAGSILIADHDASSRVAVSALLCHAGYEAREAATGEAALRAALDELPAFVILDVDLPGISGHEVCRRLRDAFGETLPILLMSEKRTKPLDRVAGLLIGADDYLAKPLSGIELLPRIRRALKRSSGFAGAHGWRPAA
jgi:two-component system, OmpR family, response regulator